MSELTCAKCGGKVFRLKQDEAGLTNAERIEHMQSLDIAIGEYYGLEITCQKCKAKHSVVMGSD